MYMIIMASGTIHAVTMCGEADGVLHIILEDGKSFIAVTAEFADSANTSTIIYRFGEMEKRHERFTNLMIVQWEGGNRYHIALRQKDQGQRE